MLRVLLLSLVILPASIVLLDGQSAEQSDRQSGRAVAFTFDDLPVVSVVPRSLEELERITGDLLASIARHRIPAIGFVNESKLQPAGAGDERRVALLRRWIRAGLEADEAARAKISSEYIGYMTKVVGYYEQQSIAIVGRGIRQTLLLHANALNARTLDALASMLKSRGYVFVSLERALEDQAYRSEDTFVGPGGITWLHRWALTQGKRGTIFAGEPAVPDWIERASK